MSVVSRNLALSAFTTLILSASAANSAPLDDCRNFAAKAAIAPCTLIIDDSKENPGNRSYAHLLRARAEMDLSDLDKAEADIAAGLAARPGFAFGYRLRGRLRGLQDRPAEARADFTKALQLSDTPVLKYLAYLERGQFLTRIKEYPDALADLDAAIHLDGAKAMAYVSRAVVYREMGNIDAALASLEWAASLEPAYWLTYVERGDIMVAQKRFNEAVTAFDLALAQRPNDARARRGRAAAVAAGGTAESAKKPGEKPEAKPQEQTKVATPAPQPAPAQQPAPAPQPTPSPSTATPAPQPPAATPPGAPPAERAPAPPGGQTADAPDPAGQAAEERKKKLQSALELRNGRKFADALVIYEAMLKAVPTDLEVAIEKGRTLMQLTRWPDAMAAFKAVIEAKGTSDNVKAVAMANQSEILATVGEYDPAIKVSSEALRLNPRHVGALYWRGFSQYQTGAFAAALADFQQAETLAPKASLFPSWEAFALIGTGDTAKAKEAIARSLAAEPDNVGALHARARLNLAAGDIAAAETDFAQVMRRSQPTPNAVQTQQLIMLHKIMKSTDAPLKPQSR